jgi:hypothetical protein
MLLFFKYSKPVAVIILNPMELTLQQTIKSGDKP